MKGTDITHNYSVGGASLNATPVAGYSVLDNSYKSDLSVGFVGDGLHRVGKFERSSFSTSQTGTVSYSGGEVLSVRTSKAAFHSSSAGGGGRSSSGSGSFVTMHGTVLEQVDFKPITFAGINFPTDDGEDYIPPTGELDPEFASPVGDVLLPLLLMAAAYAVVRWFKNWKRKRTGKRLFCIK